LESWGVGILERVVEGVPPLQYSITPLLLLLLLWRKKTLLVKSQHPIVYENYFASAERILMRAHQPVLQGLKQTPARRSPLVASPLLRRRAPAGKQLF